MRILSFPRSIDEREGKYDKVGPSINESSAVVLTVTAAAGLLFLFIVLL